MPSTVHPPICPTSGFTKRALRFFNEAEVFFAIGVSDPWDDEENPPAPALADAGTGRITVAGQTSSGTLTTANAKVRFNTTSFKAGIESYKIVALSATTYEVRKVSDDSVIAGGPWTTQASRRENIVPGLSITVTGSALHAGDYITFKVDGPIGYKKAATVKLVVPDETGDIEYYDGNYREVDPADALHEGVRHVYVEVQLRYAELPLVDFRQLTVLTGLVRENGVTAGKQNLLPSEVLTSGTVEWLLNDVQTIRQATNKETYGVVLEF